MKGTEVPNPQRSSACDCTCVLTRNWSLSCESLMLAYTYYVRSQRFRGLFCILSAFLIHLRVLIIHGFIYTTKGVTFSTNNFVDSVNHFICLLVTCLLSFLLSSCCMAAHCMYRLSGEVSLNPLHSINKQGIFCVCGVKNKWTLNLYTQWVATQQLDNRKRTKPK